MFAGALNQKALAWLAQQRECFAGRQVVVGCSGSFSTELMLLQKGVATVGIHGNDVALFSYVLGEFLCGRRADVTPRADAPAWLRKTWELSLGKNEESLAVPVAVMHILLEMLPYQKQRNPHQRRMWDGYARNFEDLVMRTAESAVEKVAALPGRMNSFTLEMVQLLFLPLETERVAEVVDALGKWSPEDGGMRYAARLEDFGRFFAVLLKCKEAEGIANSATAVLRIVEIVEEYLVAKEESAVNHDDLNTETAEQAETAG